MANPNKLRTQVVDTSKTTPQAFLEGAGAPVQTSPPEPALSMAPPEQPEIPVPQVPVAQAAPAAQEKVKASVAPDPFVLLTRAGSTDHVARVLRGMSVPGGVVLKSTFAVAPEMTPRGEALCFVPGVEIEDLKAVLNAPEI